MHNPHSIFRNGDVQRIIGILVILTIGAGIGWGGTVLMGRSRQRRQGEVPIRENSRDYKFINPLLAVGDAANLRGFKTLEQQTMTLINGYTNTHPESTTAVYFRDLNSSRWMGVNESTLFAPASMYKVATMIAHLKRAELNPQALSDQIIYASSTGKIVDEDIAPEVAIEPGKPYTIRDLIYRMIVYSDNAAAGLLFYGLDEPPRQQVFSDLGLTMPHEDDRGDTMSVQSYSLFFRVLYNATYLNRRLSEQALDLLSQTKFSDGMVAGIPPTIIVSHKYGHRVLSAADGSISAEELHDCGIVYYPNRPYVLCIMTQGNNIKELEDIIRNISSNVYHQIDHGVQP